ncbi:hypothetical protein [Janthinobacterium lividum]|uniref:hypothetical protein n=1 Tax=Janthinobacterium lividum TaxID=29581 RepID=UPI0011131FB8|nr:hypothetical protein [Janthinobacterium lividum]MCC7712215.1 hypothetical protein [Janthinobacterium lividum]WQE27108.1 hypothetical protein U0004_19120 [Janthinobacterium lividum]
MMAAFLLLPQSRKKIHMNNAQMIASAGFDISLLNDGNKSVDQVHLVSVLFDEDGAHKAGFEIVSKNSDQYRAVIRETSVVAIKRSVQKSKQIDAKTDEGAAELYDLAENRNMKIAIAVVVGMPGFVDKGVPVQPSPALLKAIFEKMPSWQEKVLAALEADGNFLTV